MSSRDDDLIEACCSGNCRRVRTLLTGGADAHTTDTYGRTVLHTTLCEGHADVALVLIEHGIDIFKEDKNNNTPLMIAASRGLLDVVSALLARGVPMNETDQWRGNALHQALLNGHVKVALLLVEHGIDIDMRDRDGYTPLMVASKYGCMDVVKALITRGVSINATDQRGMNALHIALRQGQIGVVILLIENGIDIGMSLLLIQQKIDIAMEEINNHTPLVMASQNTPLMMASQNGFVDEVTALLTRGVSINATDQRGMNSLHIALRYGRLDVAVLLIEHGIDIDKVDNTNKCPLTLAIKGCHHKVVRALLKAGVNLNRCLDGNTPIVMAAQTGNTNIVRELLNACVDISGTNGMYALHAAVLSGNTDVTQLLIEGGVDVSKEKSYGDTSLMAAVRLSNTKMVRILLDARVNHDTVNIGGSTVLHVSVSSGNTYVTQLLIEHGVDAHKEDHSGDTPLIAAIKRSDANMVRVLLEAGVNPNTVTTGSSTALHVAVKQIIKHTTITTNIVELLVLTGADISKVDMNGLTPLRHATKCDNISLMEALLHNFALHAQRNLTARAAINGAIGEPEVLFYIVKKMHALENNGAHCNDLLAKSCISHLTNFPPALVDKVDPLTAAILYLGVNVDVRDSQGHTLLGACLRRRNIAAAITLVLGKGDVNMEYNEPRGYAQVMLLDVAYLRDTRNSNNITKLLVTCGCSKEAIQGVLSCVDTRLSPDLKTWLQAQLNTVTSLQAVCRLTIRKSLGSHIFSHAMLLPLPKRLLDYVLLSEMLL